MGLFGPPNVDKMKAKGDVKGLINVLSYPNDESVREAAAAALGHIGDVSAVEPLIVALKDGDKYVRQAVVSSLVKIGDAGVLDPIIAMLKDSDCDVRGAAAGALDKLRFRPGRDEIGATYWLVKGEWDRCIEIGTPAVEPLTAALKDSKYDLREEAATMLGKIGDVRAVKPLIAALRDFNVYMRSAAADALATIGAPAIEPLIALLKDRDQNVRSAGADALAKFGASAVGPLIAAIAAFSDSDQKAREAAAGAMVKIGKPAVDPLIAALKDISVRTRSAAVNALGRIGDTRAFEPLIAALKDSDSRVSGLAAEALGKIGDARAVEPLIAALDCCTPSLCTAAAEALEKIGWQPGQDENGAAYWVVKARWDKCIEIGAPAVAPLVSALRYCNRGFGKAAAEALEKIGWQPGQDESGAAYWVCKQRWDQCMKIGPPSVEPLITAFKDSDNNVRKAAADALGKIGDYRAVGPLIAALLRDSDISVRCRAAGALGQIGDARAVEPLIAALNDSEYWPRAAAAVALGQIGDARAVEPLTAALKDNNPFVFLDPAAVPDALVKIRARSGDAELRARTVIPAQSQHGYVCAGCGKTLVGDDQTYASKREADARCLYGEVHKPGTPAAIIEVWDLRNKTFYCQVCLDSLADWPESAKHCSNCISFLSNFVRMGGIPDFYCMVRDNQAIKNPLNDSCASWQLGKPFRRTDKPEPART